MVIYWRNKRVYIYIHHSQADMWLRPKMGDTQNDCFNSPQKNIKPMNLLGFYFQTNQWFVKPHLSSFMFLYNLWLGISTLALPWFRTDPKFMERGNPTYNRPVQNPKSNRSVSITTEQKKHNIKSNHHLSMISPNSWWWKLESSS